MTGALDLDGQELGYDRRRTSITADTDDTKILRQVVVTGYV